MQNFLITTPKARPIQFLKTVNWIPGKRWKSRKTLSHLILRIQLDESHITVNRQENDLKTGRTDSSQLNVDKRSHQRQQQGQRPEEKLNGSMGLSKEGMEPRTQGRETDSYQGPCELTMPCEQQIGSLHGETNPNIQL